MTQSLVTLNLTDAQLTAVDAALTELETQLGGLIALPAAKKRAWSESCLLGRAYSFIE
jgi:hypothetical protein